MVEKFEDMDELKRIYFADILNYNETIEMKHQIEKYFGKIDILVNNDRIHLINQSFDTNQ
ncbi:unnamed protein product, partial [marine sediment metagenome]